MLFYNQHFFYGFWKILISFTTLSFWYLDKFDVFELLSLPFAYSLLKFPWSSVFLWFFFLRRASISNWELDVYGPVFQHFDALNFDWNHESELYLKIFMLRLFVLNFKLFSISYLSSITSIQTRWASWSNRARNTLKKIITNNDINF